MAELLLCLMWHIAMNKYGAWRYRFTHLNLIITLNWVPAPDNSSLEKSLGAREVSFSKHSHRHWVPPSLPFNGYWELFPRR